MTLENCVFCKIVKQEIPAKVIAENDSALAFLDIEPVADGHTIIIPKQHHNNFSSCSKADLARTMELVSDVANILNNSKLGHWGLNYLSNEEKIAGQVIFHFHVHVIPKFVAAEGFNFKVNKNLQYSIDEAFAIIKKTKYKNI